MQDKDSIRGSINKRMNVVHRCIRTLNIVLRVRTGTESHGIYRLGDSAVKLEKRHPSFGR